METRFLVAALVMAYVYWRFRAARKKIVDKGLQARMLAYLDQHGSFTVDEYVRAHQLKNSFFVKVKVLAAASDLVKTGVITSNTSGGQVFNPAEGVRFSKKTT